MDSPARHDALPAPPQRALLGGVPMAGASVPTGHPRSMLGTHVVLALAAVVVLFPFYWMISTSLKTLQQALATPPVFVPLPPQVENYAQAWNAAPFGQYFVNSTFVAVMTTLLSLIFSSAAAFAFARMEFP